MARSGIAIMNMLTGYYDQYLSHELTAWSVRQELTGLSLQEQKAKIAQLAEEPWHDFLRVVPPPVRRTVVSTALSILRYERKVGALPESLDALVPQYFDEVPMDFWSGEELRYLSEGRAFAVYSLGRNRADDNGSIRDDIVFKTTLASSN